MCGCGFLFRLFTKTDYEFLQDVSEIQSIEIVILRDVEDVDGTITPIFDLVQTVQDIESFLKDFSDVDCYNRISDPSCADQGTRIIKITYNNGDYEFIGASGQSNYKNGVYTYWGGYHSFDDVCFEELLTKYSGNDPISLE